MSDIEKIRRRIRALLDKKATRGCTEAEAMAAAEKAAELMREHGISVYGLEFEEKASAADNAGKGQKARLWPIIANCTNTAVIVLTGRSNGTSVAFVGREPGPAIAVYLRDVCERAIETEVRRFKTNRLYHRKRKLAVKRQMVAAFTGAMVYRLADRLQEIFGPNISRTALIAATSERAMRYPNAEVEDGPKRELRHVEAAIAGAAAGDRVHLAHGVGGTAAPAQIGARP